MRKDGNAVIVNRSCAVHTQGGMNAHFDMTAPSDTFEVLDCGTECTHSWSKAVRSFFMLGLVIFVLRVGVNRRRAKRNCRLPYLLILSPALQLLDDFRQR